ncbi:S-layer homology domain-containing protein [Halalkalibacter urbisdiaboli]|uniref:S-layer homology domain-containing protein n=1 Tax=Halalkalibacter urbisdiaboli TaxID=1960589 RepID=UPI000B445D4E|nr:S-layer homology domain-containing protein [Halalkalibacter urbisdiaboli]
MAYQPKSYRKFLATSVAAAMVASVATPAAAASFTDSIPAWADEAVSYLVEKGAIDGRLDGSYDASASVTRGEAAKILAVSLGLEVDASAKADFADTESHWSSAFVAAIQEQKPGVINGYSDGSFKPNGKITRQEMAKMIVEAYGLELNKNADVSFADNTGWGKDYVQVLASLGVAEGVAANAFGPNQNVTRAQLPVFVHRTEVPEKRVEVKQNNLTVESASAINSTQAVVEFSSEVGAVEATNFAADNGLTVVDAEVSASNKNEVKLTFNKAFEDNETYKVTVDGVTSESGLELAEATDVEFTYETSEVAEVALNKTNFNSTGSVGENAVELLDSVTIKDGLGRNITSEVIGNDSYNVTVATTDTSIVNNGVVVENAEGSAYVEIKVSDSEGKLLATTGAVQVTAAPYEAVSLDGVHVGESVVASAYETLKEEDKVKTSVQKSAVDKVLNVYAKDSADTIVKVNPADATITNLNPTVATVSVEGGNFVIDPVSTGTASAKIKVGKFETTVTFTVTADAKVTSGELDKSSVTLTTDASSPSNTDTVKLTLKDQYGEKIAASGDFSISASKSGVVGDLAVNTTEDVGVYEIPLSAVANGSTTVTVKAKDADGKDIFTKSFSVAVKDFGTASKYDLVVTSSSADYLDADDDTNDTGKDAVDNNVVFELFKVDSAGNKVASVAIDGTDNFLKLDTGALSDEEKALLSHTDGKLALDTLSFADASDAVLTLVNSGTVKVSAVVGGVTVDNINVSYKNTDSVASKASLRTSSVVASLGKVSTIDELLFGKYSSSKYTVNPLLTVQDQFGATMKYNVANSSVESTSVKGLANGVTVSPSTRVTNLNNVTVTDGVISLNEGKTSGSFTLVISAVDTVDGLSAVVNKDLLASPVAITVSVVE